VKSFNATLSIVVFQKWTVAAIYQNSKNDSSQTGYNFSTNQYGLQLSGRF
jgi:hypothetical protein